MFNKKMIRIIALNKWSKGLEVADKVENTSSLSYGKVDLKYYEKN